MSEHLSPRRRLEIYQQLDKKSDTYKTLSPKERLSLYNERKGIGDDGERLPYPTIKDLANPEYRKYAQMRRQAEAKKRTWFDVGVRAPVHGVTAIAEFGADVVATANRLRTGENPWEPIQEEGGITKFVTSIIDKPHSTMGKMVAFATELATPASAIKKVVVGGAKRALKRENKQLLGEGQEFFADTGKAGGLLDQPTTLTASQRAGAGIQAGKADVKAGTEKAWDKLGEQLGDAPVTDGKHVLAAIKEGQKYFTNIMKKKGIPEALTQFKKTGSVKSLRELEIAVRAHIPPNLSSAEHMRLVKIKDAIMKEFDDIVAVASSERKMIKMLDTAKIDVVALRGTKRKYRLYKEIFSDNVLVKSIANGRNPKAVDKIVEAVTRGGPSDVENIKAVMRALRRSGPEGRAASRQIGPSHWAAEMKKIVDDGGELLATGDREAMVTASRKIAKKLREFGKERMTILHAGEAGAYIRFGKAMERVSRMNDPNAMVRAWRKAFPTGTSRSRFLERYGQAIAMGSAFAGSTFILSLFGGGGSQGGQVR